MEFDKKYPPSRVYKKTPLGLSLYTQEYMSKFLEAEEESEDKEKKEDSDESEEDKPKFSKKTKIDVNPKDKLGYN